MDTTIIIIIIITNSYYYKLLNLVFALSFQLKELNIPVESGLASGLRTTQQVEMSSLVLMIYCVFFLSQALKTEQEEMKRLVLTHKQRQEEEDYQGLLLILKSLLL